MDVSVAEKNDASLLEKKLDLLLLTGQLLIQSFANSNRVFHTLHRIAKFMGFAKDELQIHIFYTTLMLNISDGSRTVTKLRKCFNHSINMAVLTEINRLSRSLSKEHYTLSQYEQHLNKIASMPRNYRGWLTIAAAGLACGGFCTLFGSDLWGAGITGIASATAMYVKRVMSGRQMNEYFSTATASFVAVIIAILSTFLNVSITPYHPIFACVLFLIPGVPLLDFMEDVIHGFTTIGVTRAVTACLAIGAIAFGMLLAFEITGFNDYSVLLEPHHNWAVIGLAGAFGALGFAILQNVPIKTLVLCALGGVLAVITRNVMTYNFSVGLPLSSLCGAMVAGFLAIYSAHKINVPAAAISIPAVIPMVPGVMMYKVVIGVAHINASVVAAKQLPILVQTVDSFVQAVATLIALSLGIVIPNFIDRFYTSRLKRKHSHT